MNSRRVAAAASLLVLAAGAYAPALAAPKAFSGTYTVSLLPDPSPNAFHTAGKGNCFNINPAAVDKHALSVPRAGKLDVVLDSPDPTGSGKTDWDLFVTDSAGETIGEGSGGTSHEETSITFKSAAGITVIVCNLAGQPSGTVTYKLS
jgi:hypothetical protein